jgi:MFS family permease
MRSLPSLLTPIVRWFLLGIVLTALAQNMFAIFIPIYISQLGASVAQVGMVLSLSSIIRLALQIPTGWLSDIFGRLRIIAIGSAIGFIGLLAMILAKDWKILLLAIILESISQLALGPNYGPFLIEHSSEKHIGRVMGVSEMIFRIVFVLGPLIGGFLASRLGIRNMLLLAALPYLVALILRIWMSRNEAPTVIPMMRQFRFRDLYTDIRLLIGLLLTGGLFTWTLITKSALDVSERLCTELLPLYVQQIGEMRIEQISLMVSLLGISTMVFSVPAGILSDRFGERLVIMIGLIITGVSLIVFINVNSFSGFAMGWTILGAARGLLSPSYMSLIVKVIPDKNRGVALGMIWTFGLVSLPTAWVGGYLWEHYSPQLPFLLGAITTFAMALVVWFTLKTKRITQKALL